MNEKRKKQLCLVGNNIGAVLVSAASVTLYYFSTKNASLIIQISSISCNVVINWWTGYESLDYLSTTQDVEITQVNNKSKTAKAFKKIATIIAGLACSVPFGVATYTFTKGSLLERLLFAGMEFFGNVPLYMYAISQFLENEGTQVYNSATNLIQDVFCSGSDEEKQTVRDIELVRYVFSKRLTEALTEIVESDLQQYPIVPASKSEKVNIFAQNLSPPKSSYTSRFWKTSCGFATAVAGESIRTLLDLASAVTLAYGSVPYECDTQQQMKQKPFSLDDPSSWGVASALMVPLFYLSIRGGWVVADSLCEYVRNLMQGKFVKPTVWKVAGKYGPLFQMALLLSAGLIACQSGYTSRVLADECPHKIRFKYDGEIIDISSDIFNAIYTYFGLNAGFIGLISLFGDDQKKAYLQWKAMHESLLTEIHLMSRQQFHEFAKNSLSQLTQNNRNTLFANLRKPGVQQPVKIINEEEAPILDNSIYDEATDEVLEAFERLIGPTLNLH